MSEKDRLRDEPSLPRIDEMFAFVAKGPNGEGIAGFQHPVTNMMVPLVGADMARVDSFRELAQQLSTASGLSIEIVKFSKRELLEVIHPEQKG